MAQIDAPLWLTTVDEMEAFALEPREPSWETDHTDPRPVTKTPVHDQRIRDHTKAYTKPRPADWWDWHCEVCNGPIGDKPA